MTLCLRFERMILGVNRFALTMGFIITAWDAQAACNSGPDFCTDDPRIPLLLAEKKEQLALEYPERLVALLDRGVQCVARIQRSPDGFSIVEVEPNGNSLSIGWAEDTEEVVKRRLNNGSISHYWLVNARRAFQCEGEEPYDERPDYVPGEDVNASLAIRCGGDPAC